MQGRMLRCSNAPCIRRTRLIGGDGTETWACGQQDCPKDATAGRDFGQPKQKGGKKR